MPVSGLVVSVAGDEVAERVSVLIAEAGPFTVGQRVGSRLAVALETTDRCDAGRWHEWLGKLPGVVKVDVAFVYLDAEEASRAN